MSPRSIAGVDLPVRYAAFFCEENIWQLSGALLLSESLDRHARVLFLMNEYGSIALHHQRAFADSVLGVWDYHVVLHDCTGAQIFDLDTTLGCPLDADDYFAATFPQQSNLAPQYRTLVRAIPVEEYLQRFSSDRSHMLDENGQRMQPFPPWSVITSKQSIDLQYYLRTDPLVDSDSVVFTVGEYTHWI